MRETWNTEKEARAFFFEAGAWPRCVERRNTKRRDDYAETICRWIGDSRDERPDLLRIFFTM